MYWTARRRPVGRFTSSLTVGHARLGTTTRPLKTRSRDRRLCSRVPTETICQHTAEPGSRSRRNSHPHYPSQQSLAFRRSVLP
jgi:hypothetical protein